MRSNTEKNDNNNHIFVQFINKIIKNKLSHHESSDFGKAAFPFWTYVTQGMI